MQSRGFARYDHLILIALIAIGCAIAIPAIRRSDWTVVVMGSLLVLAGTAPPAWWTLRDWIDERREKRSPPEP